MHKRNVNPIFQADVIDAKNGMRHSASIILESVGRTQQSLWRHGDGASRANT